MIDRCIVIHPTVFDVATLHVSLDVRRILYVGTVLIRGDG